MVHIHMVIVLTTHYAGVKFATADRKSGSPETDHDKTEVVTNYNIKATTFADSVGAARDHDCTPEVAERKKGAPNLCNES